MKSLYIYISRLENTERARETRDKRQREGYSIIGIIPLLLSQSLTQHLFFSFFFFQSDFLLSNRAYLPNNFYGEIVSSSLF